MNKSIIIQLLKIITVLLSFWFIGEKFWQHQNWIKNNIINDLLIITILICGVLYGSSQFLLSFAWRKLLIWCGHENISIKNCNRIYGKSQIAKYIPGNVFHVIGRHILGKQEGIKHIVLVGATIYEILGLICASILISLSGVILFDLENNYLSFYQSICLFIVIFLIFVLVIGITPNLMQKHDINIPNKNLMDSIIHISLIYLSYFIFFIIAGLLLVFIVKVFIYLNFFTVGKIIVIFCIAWVTGFVVPGAPGGIGVREAVIIFFIAPIIGEAQGVAVSIAIRFVTLIGDIFFFAMTSKILNK